MDIGTVIHDSDDEESSHSEDMVEIIRAVLEHLRKNGHLQSYTKWCPLFAENKFPMDNIICFLLLFDIVGIAIKKLKT